MKHSERGRELVQEAALDRMKSETPETSWCAQFQEFVPLLLADIASARSIMEKFVFKVDTGRARSKETYAEMKEWLEDK